MAAAVGGGFDEQRHRLQLEARLRQAPPQGARWTLRRVQSCFDWLAGYSPGGLSRLLRAWGFGVRPAHAQQLSPDPEYETKLARLLDCLQQVATAPTECALVFLDEMGYRAWPEVGLQWASLAPSPAPVAYKRPADHAVSHAVSNNRQWRVVGALNAWSGQLDFLDDYMVGRKQLIRFYEQLAKRYHDVERLWVVQDNWSVHRHEDVQHALTQWPQIEVVWLPTYAPWLNPIEKVWRWLRQDVLKLHRMAGDFVGLRQQVREFLGGLANGSSQLLRYVGLQGKGLLASALAHYST